MILWNVRILLGVKMKLNGYMSSIGWAMKCFKCAYCKKIFHLR